MFSGKFLQATGLAALAAALVVTALPASAQDRGGAREARSAERGSANQGARFGGPFERRAQEQRSQQRPARSEQRSQPRAAQVDRRSEQRTVQRTAQAEQRAARTERAGERAARQNTRQNNQRQNNDGQARQTDWRGAHTGRQVDNRGTWRAQQVERRGNDRQDRTERRVERRDNEWRGDARRAANNNDRWRNNNSGWRNENNNWRGNDRRDERRWDSRWRDNNRYNWQQYRNTNRVVFRLGSYSAPYRNYSYRRVGVGYRLDSLFFGNRYWINNPWQYRLPDVHGPYRWVRYYDDVLLVDIYSGQVVDVIHDFFW